MELICVATPDLPLSLCPFSSTNPSLNPLQPGPGKAKMDRREPCRVASGFPSPAPLIRPNCEGGVLADLNGLTNNGNEELQYSI